MFLALNSVGERVHIEEAVKEEKYTCPLCGGELIQKRGKIKQPHFCHKQKTTCDSWASGMSEFHTYWQGKFHKENLEKIIVENGEKHIADVKINDMVLEIQNSPFTAKTFLDRTQFYSRNNHLIWLFNVEDKLDRITNTNRYRYNGIEYTWKNAMRFGNVNIKELKLKNVDIFLQLDRDRILKIVFNRRKDGKESYSDIICTQFNQEEFLNYVHTVSNLSAQGYRLCRYGLLKFDDEFNRVHKINTIIEEHHKEKIKNRTLWRD